MLGLIEAMESLMRSFACSSLLSLVVAHGDADKILSAISSILTSNGTDVCNGSALIAVDDASSSSLQSSTAATVGVGHQMNAKITGDEIKYTYFTSAKCIVCDARTYFKT